MPARKRSRKLDAWVAPIVLVALAVGGASARAADVGAGDLQAVARSLGFLESLPHDGVIVLGLVYAPEVPNAETQAAETAKRFGALQGPNSKVFQPQIIAVDGLAAGKDRLDAIFLMPGAAAHGATIAEAVRRRHVTSISNDPACLDAKCCVLMIRTEHGVDATLDTSLADAAGAHFSSVFTMMVKRK